MLAGRIGLEPVIAFSDLTAPKRQLAGRATNSKELLFSLIYKAEFANAARQVCPARMIAVFVEPALTFTIEQCARLVSGVNALSSSSKLNSPSGTNFTCTVKQIFSKMEF
jgi:hypothetical protein